MTEQKKLLGAKRREMLLHTLQTSSTPITGSDLAKKANVSRQVIVGDISLLKAKQQPIIATSQGYMYLQEAASTNQMEREIACYHQPHETEEELNLLVDHGVMVKDVTVEHPVYGDLTASLHLSNRKEVSQFLDKIQTYQASYLLELTDGIHMHTIVGSSEKQLEDAIAAMDEKGFIVK
ncbi:transcription repressor NadR [Pontibacillus salicampi]|uniref:Transcription repressor NadR n=1 Tax=Pontibacillus salicampi TaxID=1449801 RepID=A0ABV6LPB1_9BACI